MQAVCGFVGCHVAGKQWVAVDAVAACVVHTLRQAVPAVGLDTGCLRGSSCLWSRVVWVRAQRLALSVQQCAARCC